MSNESSGSGSGSGSSGDGGKGITNVQIFLEKGMISDREILTDEGVELLNSFSRKEVRQIIKIWERLGRPDVPQSFFDAFAD